MATVVTDYAVGGGGAGGNPGLTGERPTGLHIHDLGVASLTAGGLVRSNAGNGGGPGANGSTGVSGTVAAGTAGNAIDKNGNTVTVTNNGTISGTVAT